MFQKIMSIIFTLVCFCFTVRDFANGQLAIGIGWWVLLVLWLVVDVKIIWRF